MKIIIGILVAITLVSTVNCKINYEGIIKKISKSPLMRASFERNTQIFGGKRTAEEFPCEPIAPSSPVPTSVHKVRPGDIKIVAALGDSLTAGVGITAKNIFDLLTEERGKSFSIGGDGTYEDYITIPNILKHYNPNVTGFSVKTGGLYSENAKFNVAEAGNVFQDLSDEANLLITRMKADINIDINNDWKLITILIGDNDLCKFCNEDGHEAGRYKALLEKTIQLLQDSFPRTIINLVEVLNVEITRELNKGLFCSVIHFTLCGCASYPKNNQDELDLKNVTRVYQNIVNEIATSGKFDKEDFTVVDQPLFRNTYLPTVEGKPDFSYFAPDCFHLSYKGQGTAAVALWNNMFQPIGKKDTDWGIGNPLLCPTEESPYIKTNKNSAKKTSNKSGENNTLQFKKDKVH